MTINERNALQKRLLAMTTKEFNEAKKLGKKELSEWTRYCTVVEKVAKQRKQKLPPTWGAIDEQLDAIVKSLSE